MPNCFEVRRLQAGYVVVFSDDAVHLISSSSAQPEKFGIQRITKQKELDKSADGTTLVCGYLIIHNLVRKLLLSGLPYFTMS